jgi:hypothetical protein
MTEPGLREVADELARAQAKFGPMASGHEAVAVIEEEFLEFREAVFWGRGDPRAEAVQLAAMAVRYLVDVADRAALATTGQPEHSHIWRDGELLLNGCALPHAQPEDTRTAEYHGHEQEVCEPCWKAGHDVGDTRTADPGGLRLDAATLTTVLYDWMPDGAGVSVGFDGRTAHLSGGDLAAFIFERAAEYAALTPEATAPDEEGAKP